MAVNPNNDTNHTEKDSTFEYVLYNMSNRRLVGWGASDYYVESRKACRLEMEYLVDSNPDIQGKLQEDLMVFPPEKILAEDNDEIFIIIFSEGSYYHISEELKRSGFEEYEDYCFFTLQELCRVSKELHYPSQRVLSYDYGYANLLKAKHIEFQYKELKKELQNYKTQFVPPGHFYSPIPSIEDIKQREEVIYSENKKIEAIEMNSAGQLELLGKFVEFYNEQPFSDTKQRNLRYYFGNQYFSYTDAIILYCMMRHVKPKKIIEIGSGYSSCVILDTNEEFFNGAIECTFIEPYPDRLLSLIKEEDKIKLQRSKLQQVDINTFMQLSKGDILFIDSSHVAKIDSDVNYLFFDILPKLKEGVIIHFHDIFYPFEYPKEWIYKEIAWNECYMLRSFLQYNESFRIILFNDFIHKISNDFISRNMPLCTKNTGGSIWIEKVR